MDGEIRLVAVQASNLWHWGRCELLPCISYSLFSVCVWCWRTNYVRESHGRFQRDLQAKRRLVLGWKLIWFANCAGSDGSDRDDRMALCAVPEKSLVPVGVDPRLVRPKRSRDDKTVRLACMCKVEGAGSVDLQFSCSS